MTEKPISNFNWVCDEPGSCDRGTDRFDCEAEIAEEQAIEAAYSSVTLEMSTSIAVTYALTVPIFVGGLAVLILPVILSGLPAFNGESCR